MMLSLIPWATPSDPRWNTLDKTGEGGRFFKATEIYFVNVFDTLYLYNSKSFSNVLFVTVKNKKGTKRGKWMAQCKPSAYIVSLNTPGHFDFTHHPEPTHTPSKEWLTFMLYLLSKELQASNLIHHLIIYCIQKEHLAHHCNSATSGMKDSVLGRDHVLLERSKHKLLNIMFLIKLRGNFRQKPINYPSRMLSA